MRRSACVLGVLAAAMFANALAQSPPGAPPAMAPGPMPAEETEQEAAARQVVVEWGRLIDEGRIEQAFELYVSRDFVDHSNTPRRMLNKQDIGYAETLEAFVRFIGPREGTMVEQVYVNESMVTIRGKVGRDLFMVRDGKIVAHWDTMQEGREPPSGN